MPGFPRLAVLIALGLAVAGCQRGVDANRIEQARAGEWLSYGRTYDEQRFSPLKQISPETVGKLGVAWWAEFDTDRGQEATPLVADGVLYTTTAWSKVFAFNARTGKPLWSFDPKVPGEAGFNACCDVVNRGVALWKDKVYVGTIDGRLIALDSRTGTPVWSVQTTNPARPYTITGAPRAIKGRILIGNGGAEYPVRGYVSAYDAETGDLDWRFYMTPNPRNLPDGAASDKVLQDKAYATWSEGAWRLGGGGATPWDAISYDVKADVVMIGTGNAGPWNDKIRSGGKGDNLFATSIVALRPETGEYVWHYQTTPRDAWDYDAVQQVMTADLTIAGKPRRVAMQANKNGFFYVLDTATGRLVSAEKFIPANWADRVDLATGRPVEAAFARYENGAASHQTPGPLGGHNWQPMAFSPLTGLVYIPAQIASGSYADPESFKYVEGAWNTAMRRGTARAQAQNQPPPAVPRGELIAWDPAVGKVRWRVPFTEPWRSGVLATGGGLVFHAAGHEFQAFDAATGKQLWSYDTGANPIAPAASYEIDGQQYVALMVGYGGAGGIGGDQPRRKGRLLVFKLGGGVTPKAYPVVATPGPLDLAAATPGKGEAHRGEATYRQFCGACHGGGVFLPNLARSPAILDPDGFLAIVGNGALREHGMAPFKRFLTRADIEDLRTFLLAQAKTSSEAKPTTAHAQ